MSSLTPPSGSWPLNPAGTEAQLDAIVAWVLDPAAIELAATKREAVPPFRPPYAGEVRARLWGEATILLDLLRASDRSLTWSQECESADKISRLARELQAAMTRIHRGQMFTTLHEGSMQHRISGSETTKGKALAAEMLLLCGASEEHPLDAIASAAVAYSDWLRGPDVGRRGHENLQTRLSGDPRDRLADGCATTLVRYRGFAPVSNEGSVRDLMEKVWLYAIGRIPDGIDPFGRYAKAGARRVRDAMHQSSS